MIHHITEIKAKLELLFYRNNGVTYELVLGIISMLGKRRACYIGDFRS